MLGTSKNLWSLSELHAGWSKISRVPVWTTCWMIKNFPANLLKHCLRCASSMRAGRRFLVSGRLSYWPTLTEVRFSVVPRLWRWK
jgi:hypothetical protein